MILVEPIKLFFLDILPRCYGSSNSHSPLRATISQLDFTLLLCNPKKPVFHFLQTLIKRRVRRSCFHWSPKRVSDATLYNW